MEETRILGIMIEDRIKEAGRVQRTLSEYAGSIQNRLGFHEVSSAICSRVGVILLHLKGDPESWDRLERDLEGIGGIRKQRMSFKH